MLMAEGDQDIVQDDKKLVQGHDYLEQELEENLEQSSEQKLEQDLENFEQNSNEGLEQNLENDLDQVNVEQNISQDVDQESLAQNAEENFVQSFEQNLEQDSELKAVQDLEIEQKLENKGDAIDGIGEKRWPGWPGETVFRMLVPVQKVGSIIGRKGEFIKKIVEETRARVKILDGPPGTMERAVMVSAKEEPDSSIPPAMDGLLRVHKRILDGLDNEASQAPSGTGVKVSTKMLVPASQAGSLIGKQGSNVKSIQESSNCVVRVLGTEELPIFALPDDRVVELLGDATSVHRALELVASHLRKFLVDRSIIPLFETQMQMTNQRMNHMAPPQNWGPPQGFLPSAGGGHGFGSNPPYVPPPRQYDNFYPPADMPPPMEKQPHQGISNYGREAPLSGHPSSTGQTASSMLAQQATHQLQIPLSYADAVIGTAGANISYIRRVSGATVTIQETRGVPGEMTVEISGSASQVQTAEQLVQNFMAEAAAAATQGQGGGGSTDHNYNPYAAHGSAYASPPSNLGHAGHGGAYGSMYSSNYGY